MLVYPVIHVETLERARAQAQIALHHGVAGIFLISHAGDDELLLDALRATREQHPNAFLGANFIRRSLLEALTLLERSPSGARALNAIWTDRAELGPAAEQTVKAQFGWAGVHFGGVAFKYQSEVALEDLPALGKLAAAAVDVPTTSGPATGVSAQRERIEALRSGLGEHPLALASGITPKNVGDYRDLISHALVATGINSDGFLDESKLAALLTATSEGAHYE